MAPQVTIYFSKLNGTQSRDGHARLPGHRVSFIIDQPSISSDVSKPNHDVKVNGTSLKIDKTQSKRISSKNALRNARKRDARALKKSTNRAQSREATKEATQEASTKLKAITATHDRVIKTTIFKANQAHVTTHILIGSIPIKLFTIASASVATQSNAIATKNAIVKFVKGEDEVLTRAKARTLNFPQRALQRSTKISTYDCSSKGEKEIVELYHLRSQPVVNKISFTNDKSKKQAMGPEAHIPLGAFKSRKMVGAFPERSSTSKDISKLFKKNDDTKSETMSVMVTNTSTMEEQIQELRTRLAQAEAEVARRQELEVKKLANIEAEAAKRLAEKEAEIEELVAKMAFQINQKDKKKVDDTFEYKEQERIEKTGSSTVFTLQDIKTMIAEGIREMYVSSNPQISGYLKPYPPYYDALPFPKRYQKPSFDKFDGINSSPHEHLAHFYSACGETSQSDAFLVRQFVQSLKGAAFTWYSQLQPGSILTWDDMQKAFLAQFVSSKKKVSIIDLAETKQKPDEGINGFISRWRSLNLQCSEKLTEHSAVQMCSNNLLPEIATFVSTAEPQTFEALVSKASNVERQIARKKIMTQKASFKDHEILSTDESLATFVKTDIKSNACKGKEGFRKLTLKERKEAKYSFNDEDVEQIFDELYKAKGIELPKPKRTSEVNKTKDPKCCRYHCIVSHPTKDCFVLKNIIQELVNNKEIEVETSSPK
ncbi:hypothetical protein M0R45_034994 [Rubus argutus]|uniref:Retrotransposon gag domain-containing protein n=1 Tax=Rubus argutus TaxID=59490 RepID=A0AAW1VSV2_RUBAR